MTKSDSQKPFWHSTWFATIIFGTITIVAYWKLWSGGQLAYGDTTVFPPSAKTAWDAFASAWQAPSNGLSNPQTLNTLFQSLLTVLAFGNVAIAQKIFHLLPFVLGFACVHYFLRRFTERSIARSVAAFFYMVNPVTLGTLIGGAAGMLYVHALFPLVVAAYFEFENTNNFLRTLIIFILIFGLSIIWGPVPYLLFPFALVLGIKALIRKNYRGLGRLIAGFGLGSIGAVLLNAPFWLYLVPFFAEKARFFTTNVGNLNTANLTETLVSAFAGEQSVSFGLGGTYFVLPDLNFLLPLNYVLVGLIFLSLVITNSATRRKILPWAVGSLFILSFLVATHFGWTIWLYKTIPTLLTFRSPAKIVLLLAFTYLPLLVVLVDRIEGARKAVRITGVAAVVFIIGLYAYPFWTGDGFISKSKPAGAAIKVPSKFEVVAKTIPASPKQRSIWLPKSYESTELKSRSVDQANLSLPLGYGDFIASPYVNYVAKLDTALSTQDKNFPVAKYSAIAGNRFLIVDKNPSDPKLDSQAVINYLSTQPEIKLWQDSADFAIFENRVFKPIVSTIPKVVSISGEQSADKFTALIANEGLDPTNTGVVFGQAIKDLQFSAPMQFVETKSSLTRHEVELTAKEPTLVYLAEPYHPLWQASINGQKLEHLNINLHNGFIVPKDTSGKLKISFRGQIYRTALLVTAALSWFLIIFALIYTSRKNGKN